MKAEAVGLVSSNKITEDLPHGSVRVDWYNLAFTPSPPIGEEMFSSLCDCDARPPFGSSLLCLSVLLSSMTDSGITAREVFRCMTCMLTF